jgi:hypothetical protein
VTSAGRDDVVRTALAALAAPEPEPASGSAPDGTTGPARVLRDWDEAFSAVLAELGFGPRPAAAL